MSDPTSTAVSISALIKQKDEAYKERNRCVAGMARLALDNGYAAWLGRHTSDPRESADNPWDPEWMNIVFISLPTGQLSWHLHDSDVELFSFLRRDETGIWDGHSTEEKYERLTAFTHRGRRA
jgi:hypothetical protein